MAYVKPEVMAEVNQATAVAEANNNHIPNTYAWPDQADTMIKQEAGFSQNAPPPQFTQSQFQQSQTMKRNITKQRDNDDKKIFIGGLHYNTTEATLNQYFSQYGKLEDVVVIRHPDTKRSRGFGFVTFTSQEEVDACQKARPHILDNKTVETKRAVPRGTQTGASNGQQRGYGSKPAENKVFVGGIKEEVDDEDLKQYFSSFGNVKQVKILVDKMTGRKRGFAFVEFDDYDPVHKCILKRDHQIKGQRVDVKNAVNKKESNYGQRNMMNVQPRNNPNNVPANYSWMNGSSYGQPAGPGGYGWADYYGNGYGGPQTTTAPAHSPMNYGQGLQDGYGYGHQVYGASVVPQAGTGGDQQSMMAQMYPGYGGVPSAHGYGSGMSAATNGGGPIRTPPHKGYRQSPYQAPDNEHKK